MSPLQKNQCYWGHCNKKLVESTGPCTEIFSKEFCCIMLVVSCPVLSADWLLLVGMREFKEITDPLFSVVKMLVETTTK